MWKRKSRRASPIHFSATLSPQEKAQVEAKPTDNADAYVLYLRARDYQTRPDNLMQDFRSAMRSFRTGDYVRSQISLLLTRGSPTTTSNLYHFYEPTEPLKQKAHAEALESLRLQPNLGEGHLALGMYHYYMEGDYDAALRELALAARALPNDGDVGLYTAAIERRRGHWTAALAAYEHAEACRPAEFRDALRCFPDVFRPARLAHRGRADGSSPRAFSGFFQRKDSARLY